jgi:hypothetical protein
MQIKAISLFIASYLVISTVAAPKTLTPKEAVAAGDVNGGVGDAVDNARSLPVVDGLLGGRRSGGFLGGRRGGGLGGGIGDLL